MSERSFLQVMLAARSPSNVTEGGIEINDDTPCDNTRMVRQRSEVDERNQQEPSAQFHRSPVHSGGRLVGPAPTGLRSGRGEDKT